MRGFWESCGKYDKEIKWRMRKEMKCSFAFLQHLIRIAVTYGKKQRAKQKFGF
jgi:hypothetical protein